MIVLSVVQSALKKNNCLLNQLYRKDKCCDLLTVITRHVNNVFKENELDRESNVQKMHIAKADRPVSFGTYDYVIYEDPMDNPNFVPHTSVKGKRTVSDFQATVDADGKDTVSDNRITGKMQLHPCPIIKQ